MNRPTNHLLAALALVVAGLAYSQSTLGNMFKLGSSTTANLPTNDAGLLIGAIIFDLDAGAPKYNDGTTWQSFGGGGSSGSNYWLDGGTYYATNTVKLLPQGDGGQTFWYVSNLVEAQPIVAYNPKTTFGSLTGGFVMAHPNNYPLGFTFTTEPTTGFDMSAQYGMWFSPGSGIYFNGGTQWTEFNTGLNIGSSSASVTAQPTSFIGLAANTGGRSARFAYMHNSSTLQGLHVGGQYADSSGKNGVEFEYNTTRLDLGTGGSDYCSSDGTGIETPSYWESTRAFTSGAGVIANAVTISPTASASYTSSAATAQGNGTVSYNTDTQRTQIVSGGQFTQLGRPQYQRMGWSTSIPFTPTLSDGGIPLLVDGGTIFSAPYINESVYVSKSSAGTTDGIVLVETVTGTARNSVQLSGYTYFPLTTAASVSASALELQATTAGGGAQSIIPTGGQPSMCAAVRAGPDVSSTTYIVGLIDVLNTSGNPTTTVHAYFLYNSASGGNWQTCLWDTSEHCTNTGIAVSADTRYELCLYVSAARGYKAFINGNYVTGSDAFVLPAGLGLAPLFTVQTAAASARTLYAGPYQVDYW